jgi:RNA polymerase sigma factor (TIGR02999 family)
MTCMGLAENHDVTDMLDAMREGGGKGRVATDLVAQAVYDELRRLASNIMRSERSDHTLQPTELVHEAYARLVNQEQANWESRAHFIGIAAHAMREILVDYARKRAAKKRGGSWQRVTLDDRLGATGSSEIELIELNDALNKLYDRDDRMGRIVELRVFGGLTVDETACVLCIGARTVARDWRVARMWLAKELAERRP